MGDRVAIQNEALARSLLSDLPADPEPLRRTSRGGSGRSHGIANGSGGNRGSTQRGTRGGLGGSGGGGGGLGGTRRSGATTSLVASQMDELEERRAAAANERRRHLEERAAEQRERQALSVARAKARAEADFEDRLRAFDEEEAHAAELEEKMQEAEEVRLHKREKLYREWEAAVYRPCANRARERAEAVGAEEVRRLKRELFEKYLEATRGKRGVFRDVVIEGDYDPFEATRRIEQERDRALAASHGRSGRGSAGTGPAARKVDPVKRDLVKRAREDAMIAEAEGRPAPEWAAGAALGRKTLDTKLWDRLGSTPYGDRPPRERKGGESSVVFDHYNPVSEAEVRRELGRTRGKRTVATNAPGSSIRGGGPGGSSIIG